MAWDSESDVERIGRRQLGRLSLGWLTTIAAVLSRAGVAEAGLQQEGDALRAMIPRIRDGRVVARGSEGRATASGIVDAPLSSVLRASFALSRLAGVFPGVTAIRVLSRSHGHREVELRLRGGRRLRGRVTIRGHADGTHALDLEIERGLGHTKLVFAGTPGGRTVAAVTVALSPSLLPIGPASRHLRNGAVGCVAGLRRLARRSPHAASSARRPHGG